MISLGVGMAKSAPNSSGPQIIYIFELELKSDSMCAKISSLNQVNTPTV